MPIRNLTLPNEQTKNDPTRSRENKSMKTTITLMLVGRIVLVLSVTRAFEVEGVLGGPLSGMQIAPFAGVIPPEPGLAVATGETYYEGSIGGGRTAPIAGPLVANGDVK